MTNNYIPSHDSAGSAIIMKSFSPLLLVLNVGLQERVQKHYGNHLNHAA